MTSWPIARRRRRRLRSRTCRPGAATRRRSRFDLGRKSVVSADLLRVWSGVGTEDSATIGTSQPLLIINDILEPRMRATAPRNGPTRGGTRVVIFGDGFEQPLQVFFNDREAQIVEMDLHHVTVLTPPADSVRPAVIRITNRSSGRSGVLFDSFDYVKPIAVAAIVPD